MPDIITLDFETYYDDEFSLKKMPTLQYVASEKFQIHGVGIKINDQPCEWVTDMEAFSRELPALTKHHMLAHNSQFDGLINQYHFNTLFEYYLDTLSMARGLNPHGSASLEELCKILWPNDESMRKGKELETVKGLRVLTPEQDKVLGDYCINDVELTYAAFRAMPWYPASELDVIDLTCKMYIRPKLLLDEELAQSHMEETHDRRKAAVAKTPFDWKTYSSNTKYAALLINEFNLTPPKKVSKTTKKPTWAFGKKDLPYINFRANHPELNDVFMAREEVKSTQEESRSKRLLEAARVDHGQVRVPLNYYRAHTGRWGGGEKLNLQNLGRKSKLRKALYAEDGHYVYVRDLSQIEARVNATAAGQDDLVEQFRRNEDVYSIFASDIYNRPIDRKRTIINDDGEEECPDETEGFVGKICILGLGYAMGPPTFRTTMAVGAMGGPPVYFTLPESQLIVHKYRSKNHKIKDAWDQCERFIFDMACPNTDYEWGPLRIQTGRIILPNGMALNYPHLHRRQTANGFQWVYYSRDGWKSIYGGKLWENIIQALARIITTDAMVEIEKASPHIYVVLNVHDEILAIAPDTDPKEIDEIMAAAMNKAPWWMPDLPVNSAGGWAKNYSK